MSKKSIINDDGSIEVVADKQPKKVEQYTPAPPKEYVFKLVSDSDYSVVYLANEDTVYDPETDSIRAIRYIDGVPSIFVDEQDTVPESLLNTRPSIIFRLGVLRVSSMNKNLIKFLTMSNLYDKNENRLSSRPPRYTLVNLETSDKESLELVRLRIKAQTLAMDADMVDLVPHAKYLNISFTNEYGLERKPDSIRADYVNKAQASPEEFLKTFDNPIVKAKFFVEKAFNMGVITTNIIKGQAHWGATKALIANVPIDSDPVTYLSNYCFKDDEGKAFYTRLKELVG